MRFLLFLLVSAALATAQSKAELEKIRAGLPGTKRELKKLLPKWREAAESDAKLVPRYHEAVSLGRAHKLKANYLTTTIKFADAKKRVYLRFEHLRGGRWIWERRAGLGGQAECRIRTEKYDPALRLVVYPEGVAAPTTKKAADVFLLAYKMDLRDPKVNKPALRRFNKHYPKCYYVEVSGLDKKGKFHRVRAWFLAGRTGHYTTAVVEVREHSAKRDFEVEAILASIRDP